MPTTPTPDAGRELPDEAAYGAGPAIAEARTALRCLRLEVPPAVADDVQRLIEAAFTELKREADDAKIVAAMRRPHQPTEEREECDGHDQPCYYCGKPCSVLSGKPSLWPVALCHPEEPG